MTEDTNYLVANYHTHTKRCQHAVGEEREYIEQAIEQGIQILGFSDHIPCPFKTEYISHIRMTMDEAEEYMERLRKYQKEYRNDIHLYAGFEAEYIPEFYEEQIKLCDRIGCDYLILGQHFMRSEEFGPYSGGRNTSEELLIEYVDSIITAMKTGRFRYLAHPDLIYYVGEDEIYQLHMKRLCEAMKQMHIPMELNILGARDQRQYPTERFWELAGQVGNDVIIGIDAHSPNQIRQVNLEFGETRKENGYRICKKIVDKYDLHQIHILDGLQ